MTKVATIGEGMKLKEGDRLYLNNSKLSFKESQKDQGELKIIGLKEYEGINAKV